MADKNSYPFEEALEKLSGLVEKMEKGDLTLEESLKTFEEGIKLSKECQKALTDAEKKVKLLLLENDQINELSLENTAD
ncbi:MAG: exodeoxyribonuclease VII small subunit [Gammaproteobacteria bacterium]|nr:exodeoxyribonuclease VII small subunit [Gammaproteobacteria bacterium]|tara:strand:+ start:71 stop:307 length:237 start_codon:yes stop_codon:yes gene_type:complete